MHRLGIAAAMNGISFESARVVAQTIAGTTGLVSDYGLYPALRHFDRGFLVGEGIVAGRLRLAG